MQPFPKASRGELLRGDLRKALHDPTQLHCGEASRSEPHKCRSPIDAPSARCAIEWQFRGKPLTPIAKRTVGL